GRFCQLGAEIDMRHPAVWVPFERGPVQGFSVTVRTALLVGQHGKRGQDEYAQATGADAHRRRGAAQQPGQAGGDEDDWSEARLVLEMVRDVGKEKGINVEESQC